MARVREGAGGHEGDARVGEGVQGNEGSVQRRVGEGGATRFMEKGRDREWLMSKLETSCRREE